MKILPISINKSHKKFQPVLRNTLLGVAAFTVPLTLHSERIIAKEAIKNSSKYVTPESIINFESSPMRFMSDILRDDIEGMKISKFLSDNKKDYQKLLNIDKKDYPVYENAIKKIADPTRKSFEFGDPGCGFSQEMIEYKNAEEDIPVIKTTNKIYKKSFNDRFKPLNSERLRLYRVSKSEKEELDNLNVDYKKDYLTTNDYIIGALVRLKTLDKKYPEYLKTISEIKPDLDDINVKNSIINSRRIMSNDIISDAAIYKLKNEWITSTFLPGELDLFNGELNDKDIEDLRIFAKTIVLDKSDFLAEMWDKNPIIPLGKKTDSATANILSIYRNTIK